MRAKQLEPIYIFHDEGTNETFYQPPSSPRHIIINGEFWPPEFSTRNFESALQLSLREDDIFIITYPKCGTTWVQHIVHQLIGKDKEYAEGVGEKSLCYVSPMIECEGAEFCESVSSPRVLKSHLTWPRVPKNTSCPYIVVVRNPKDCVVSYFHHNKKFEQYNFDDGDFNTFYELFMSGDIGCGDYFEHLTSMLEALNDDNIVTLLVKFEDLLEDLEGEITRISGFIGESKSAKELRYIAENSTLQAMKRNQGRFFPVEQLGGKEGFIRKGSSRDWKNYLTEEQSRRIDEKFMRYFSGTEVEHWWKKEMEW